MQRESNDNNEKEVEVRNMKTDKVAIRVVIKRNGIEMLYSSQINVTLHY
jgi:hypothetical protein